jgi:hypothetical protein
MQSPFGTLVRQGALELDNILLQNGRVLFVEKILLDTLFGETLNLSLLGTDLVCEIDDIRLQSIDCGLAGSLQSIVLGGKVGELLVVDKDLLLTILF